MATVDLSPQTIQALSDAVRGSSGSFASASYSSAGESTEASREQRAHSVRFAAATKDIKTASKAFMSLSKEQNKTADQIKKQVELNSHFIGSAIDSLSKLNISPKAFDGLEELFRQEEQLKIAAEIRDNIDKMTTKGVFDNNEYDRFVAQLDDVGATFEDLGLIVNDMTVKGKRRVQLAMGQSAATKSLTERTNDLSKTVKKTTDAMEKSAKRAELATQAANGFAASLGVTGVMAVAESRKAMERGVAEARSVDGLMDSIYRLKISTSDYMDILGDTRNIQHAVNQSGGNFTEELVSSAKSLRDSGFVTSATEAAQASADMMKNVTMMGVAFGDLEQPMQRQKDLYAKNFRAMGFSMGQFNQLTEDLLADTDVRNDLARLNKQERQAYIESLQQRTAENMQMGYSIERAKELNKHFAKISGMNPLERLKKAATERAMLGTLGMAREGAELQQLMTKLPSLQGEEKEAAQARMTEIRAAAANELKRRRGQSVASDVTYGMVSEKLGFKDTADTFQNEALEGRKFDGKQALATQAAIGEVTEATKLVVAGVDQFQAAATSSATVLGTIAASWIFTSGMQKGMEGINSKLTGLLTQNAMGGGGGLMGGAKAVGLGALFTTAAVSVGELIASGGERTSLSDMVKDTMQEVFDAIGGTIAEMTGFNDEMREEQKKTRELMQKQLETQQALVSAATEGNSDRKQLTQAQIAAQEAQRRQQNLDNNLVPAK